MFDRLRHAKYFFKFDFKSGFQDKIFSPEAGERTAFKTKIWPFWIFCYANWSQKHPCNNSGLHELNILREDPQRHLHLLGRHQVSINSDGNHICHHRLALESLDRQDQFVAKTKFELLSIKTKLLRVQVGKSEAQGGDKRKEVVQKKPTSTSMSEPGSFFSLLQFFWRFIHHIS